MSPRHQLIFALSIPLSLALLWALGAALAQPAPAASAPGAADETQFNGERARADLARWSAAYPARVVGSPESAAFREQLIAELQGLGLRVETQPFTVRVASQARAGVNVVAQTGGAPDVPFLLLLTHYDTPAQGGRDNLAAVAALVELARVLGPQPAGAPLVFVFADSREYGQAWGARYFAETLPRDRRVLAALSVEAVEGQDPSRLRVESAGFQFGYAPVWLRESVLHAARVAGASASELRGVDEALSRAFPFAMTGYGQFLRVGLPGIGLSGGADLTGLNTLGRTVELWARDISAQADALPPAAPGEWRLDEARLLPAWATAVLPLLVFVPLFVVTGLALWAQRPRLRDLGPELVALVGAGLPLLNGLAAAYLLVRLGLLPGYEWFPASPGDPFLLQPTDWAMLVVLVVAGVSAWDIFGRARGWGRLVDQLALPHRRVTLLAVFSLLVLAVGLLNSLTAVLLLAPAAWLWPWIAPRPGAAGRAINVMLALGGLLPFVGVCVGLALTPGLGFWWWFLTVGAVYGLYPWLAVAAFVVSAALLVRFLVLGLRAEAAAQQATLIRTISN